MPKWYQSLYWRIAIGFVLFLAAMLAVQGGALVYLLQHGSRTRPRSEVTVS